jgi:hypothetical protein
MLIKLKSICIYLVCKWSVTRKFGISVPYSHKQTHQKKTDKGNVNTLEPRFGLFQIAGAVILDNCD